LHSLSLSLFVRAENLELAFTTAENLGISRLLDVEDILEIPKPEE
jgi:hypothetical protein